MGAQVLTRLRRENQPGLCPWEGPRVSSGSENKCAHSRMLREGYRCWFHSNDYDLNMVCILQGCNVIEDLVPKVALLGAGGTFAVEPSRRSLGHWGCALG
jgi:hypothetical protein